MIGFLIVIAARVALLPALLLTPYLVARRLKPDFSLIPTIALTGFLSMLLNTAVPIILHVAGIPITAASLATTHILTAAAVIASQCYRHPELLPEQPDCTRRFCMFMGLFVILVLPLTNLAGIDTYKWQGLATNVSVQASIPWLVHPLSLFGFTPRSYPSAQPLLLATVQLLGGMGVGAGFFTVSALCGITGMCAAWCLGKYIGGTSTFAMLFSVFFTFSPVFMRYNHWATGRGFFLAVVPLFILALVKLPIPGAWLMAAGSALLLCLCHKAGLIAVVVIPACILPTFIPMGKRHAFSSALLGLAVLAVSVALSPSYLCGGPAGNLAGFIRGTASRFGWLTPTAFLGFFVTKEWTGLNTPRKKLLCAFLFTLPVAHAREMYGALLALPFIALAATDGLTWLMNRLPDRKHQLRNLAISLSVAASLVIVAHRSLNAAPDSAVIAANFLNEYDPSGPYRVEAPGRIRVQIHAYVSGCPRFEVQRRAESGIQLQRPPPIKGHPADILQEWIDYLRVIVEVPEIETAWYGESPRMYYVVANGNGRHPADGRLLFENGEVEVYAPHAQADP